MKFYWPIYSSRLLYMASTGYRRAYSGQSGTNLSYLKIKDKFTGEARKIAYERTNGSSRSEVLYIPGLMSSMSGFKAEALHTFCKKNNVTYTRYDPSGLGSSNSMSLNDVRLSHWIEDAESILNTFEKPKIVVASSLGASIGLKLCQKYPKNFESLVLLAPGVNVASSFMNYISQKFPKILVERLEKGEVVEFNHPEYGAFPMSYAFIDDMYKNDIDLSSNLKVPFPVRIIHGTKDEDVPYKRSIELMEKIESTDLQLIIIKDAPHRLSTEKNLEVIWDTVKKLIHLRKGN